MQIMQTHNVEILDGSTLDHTLVYTGFIRVVNGTVILLVSRMILILGQDLGTYQLSQDQKI